MDQIEAELNVEKDSQKSLCHQIKTALKIDWYMFPAKITYFLANGIDGAFKPYALSFLVGVGLNKAEAGLVTGLRLLGMTFAGPCWGFITDKRQNHVFIVILMAIMSLILVSGQPLLSLWIGDETTNTCPALEIKSNITSSGVSPTSQPTSSINFRSTRFLVLLFINILASCFDGCIITIVDAGVVKRIWASSSPKEFGWNRMFGTIGFSAGSFLSGLISDEFPYTDKVNCFTGAYIVLSCFLVGLLLVCPFLFTIPDNKVTPLEMTAECTDTHKTERNGELFFDKNSSDENVTKESTRSLTTILLKTLKDFEMIIFLSTVLVCGILQGVLISFTTLRIKELGGPTFLAGFVISLVALCQLPSMTYASKLVHCFRGYWWTFFICCTIYSLSFIILGYIQNPWHVIPVYALVGFAVGLMIVTPVLYIRSNTDPKVYTTMLSIRTTTYFGIGYIIANIAGGQAFSRHGGSKLFEYSGLLALPWNLILLVVIIVKHFKECRKARNMTYKQTI